MQQFKDGNKKIWDLAINPTSISRVKDLTGFFIPDLLNEDKKAMHRFGEDMELKVNILFALCLSQAEEAGISDKQFGEAFHNWDILAEAQEALLKAFSDFCRKPVRLVLERGMKNAKIMEKEAELRVEKMLADPNLDSQMQELMASELGIKSGSAPGSLESTPVSGHSET